MASKGSRLSNSLKNTATEYIGEIIVLVLRFVTRTIFIKTLGESYLGISGYFTDILNMLSLTELGFGTAIIYKLYKPIEEKNEHRIILLMKLYKRIYQIIGLVIVALGLIMVPFLPKIINGYESLAQKGINAIFIFALYLFQSASTYWFAAYKSSIVKAHQKAYKLNMIGFVFTILTSVVQIAVLKIMPMSSPSQKGRAFIVYTVAAIIIVVMQTLTNAHIANKMYPYINKKIDEKITKAETVELFKDCYALFLYKINSTVMRSTGSVILTYFVGLEIVGLYSNYILMVATFKNFILKFMNGINASLGSLHASGDLDHQEEVFRVINYISFWIFGIATVGIAVLGNQFIGIWIGKQFVVSSFTAIENAWFCAGRTFTTPVILLIAIETYCYGLKLFLAKYRNTMGLFRQSKYRPVASMIINLCLSFVLVPEFGIAGAIFSTITSDVTTTLWYDPRVVYKVGLKRKNANSFFIKNLYYVLITVISGFLSKIVCSRLTFLGGWTSFIFNGFTCVFISVAIIVIMTFFTPEFKYTLKILKRFTKRAKRS